MFELEDLVGALRERSAAAAQRVFDGEIQELLKLLEPDALLERADTGGGTVEVGLPFGKVNGLQVVEDERVQYRIAELKEAGLRLWTERRAKTGECPLMWVSWARK